jgi:hypothetical protein
MRNEAQWTWESHPPWYKIEWFVFINGMKGYLLR